MRALRVGRDTARNFRRKAAQVTEAVREIGDPYLTKPE